MRYDDFTIQSESYRKDFWNKMMKGQTAPYETMNKGAISSDTYVLPYDSNRKYMDVLKEECIFRQLATSIKSADSDLDIWVSDSDEQAEWAPSNTQQFIKDAAGQFDKKKVHPWPNLSLRICLLVAAWPTNFTSLLRRRARRKSGMESAIRCIRRRSGNLQNMEYHVRENVRCSFRGAIMTNTIT